MTQKPIDWATKLELAVRADVCPQTITKLLAGRPVRGRAGRRARAVLAEAGLLPAEGKGGSR